MTKVVGELLRQIHHVAVDRHHLDAQGCRRADRSVFGEGFRLMLRRLDAGFGHLAALGDAARRRGEQV